MSQGPRVSRLSVRPRPRDSIFPGGAELYRSGDAPAVCSPNLRECVLAMEDCCEEVFLLIDEGTVRKYKADLSDEIEPQITELISRAEKGLKALLKKESALQAKVKTAQSQPQTGTTTSNKLGNRRLQLLAKQRERLEDEIRQIESEVLSLEAKQKR
ncbi:hypothetical protein EVG20_g4453 [Dentipellis fragilis]|uniref:Uncharacterized protein n=1 Tax=Dentipellis fragilis TaxID=205917 RepID=A0A4Y9YWG5_9AGAM|nr:hypothetical protein EVG20_g4453 [Dentipellis fragilis]